MHTYLADSFAPSHSQLLFRFSLQVWFQNRRAKFRKQERLNQQKGSGCGASNSGSSQGHHSPGGHSNGALSTSNQNNSNNQSGDNGPNNQSSQQQPNGKSHGGITQQQQQQQQVNANGLGHQEPSAVTTVELKPLRPVLRGHDFLGVPSF